MSDSTVPVAGPGQDEDAARSGADHVGDIADGLIRDFHPVTILALGSGAENLVAALRERGVDASGGDGSESIEDRYDLIVCADASRLSTPAEAEETADLCAAAETVVLSGAATPEDWAARLAERGFIRSLDRDLSYLSPTAAAFVRAEEDRIETVRRYDRAWWQLRRETAEVRRALEEHRRRLIELEGRAVNEDLERGLEQNEAEMLRLRDLLIGKEAELGVVTGRVAELEAQAGLIDRLKHRRNQIRGAIAKLPGAKQLKQLIRRR